MEELQPVRKAIEGFSSAATAFQRERLLHGKEREFGKHRFNARFITTRIGVIRGLF